MRFDTVYRVSQYVMLALATLALNIDSIRDYPWIVVYPIAAVVAGAVALLTVDRNPSLGIPRDLANVLAMVSILPSFLEYRYESYLIVLAAGHWVTMLQLVKTFLPKSVEDDWFLFLLALTQVLVGAFLPGDRIGLVIILWATAAVWTLGLFHLRREALRRDAGEPAGLAGRVADRSPEPYPGLFVPSFLVSMLGLAFFTLTLGLFIFLLMPRWEASATGRRNSPRGQSLTGFSETVQLGQLGEILASEDVVMTIELYDQLDRRISVDDDQEFYWRGITLCRYDGKTWRALPPVPVEDGIDGFRASSPPQQIRQHVKLEVTPSEYLFSLRPIAGFRGRDLQFNQRDGTLYREDLRPRILGVGARNKHPGTFDYTVISDASETELQDQEMDGTRDRDGENYLNVPDDLRAVLEPIVENLIKETPPEDVEARARALESYLRDGNRFTYTLQQGVTNRSIDPVADFLLNRRAGHCEYFASALALMLRAAGIPSRVVNGFKGGDWNTLGQAMLVRKKHAHSWVEAYLGQSGRGWRRHPLWLRLDGTPAAAQAEAVASVGSTGRRFRNVGDFLRYVWVFYIVGFDAERQQRAIYAPIAQLIQEVRRGAMLMYGNLSNVIQRVLRFRDIAALFSLSGFLISFFGLLLLYGVVRLGMAVGRRVSRLWKRTGAGADELASAVASYRRLVQILASVGLERPPTETPREFARRSAIVLADQGSEAEQVASVPTEVVEAFYRIRYGGQNLSTGDIQRIDSRLDLLNARLHPRES
jgi:transglutaminase-like putative cysteine protease